jgi:hypothetical protein
MRVEIKDKNLGVTKALRGGVEPCLRLALGRFANRIGRATLILEKGSASELRCRIALSVSEKIIVAEAVGPDLDSTVARAATRAADSVARLLTRERSAS